MLSKQPKQMCPVVLSVIMMAVEMITIMVTEMLSKRWMINMTWMTWQSLRPSNNTWPTL